MAVTRDDLGRDRFRLEPHLGADILLHVGIDIGKGADRAGDGAGGNVITGGGQTDPVALHLGIERCQLEPEGDRLGMDAVGTADADRVLVLHGPHFKRFQDHVQVGQQFIGSLGQLHRQAGIQNVRGGHALVDEARLGADVFGNRGQERDHIVLYLGLDDIDTGDIEITLGTDDRHDVLRDDTQLSLGLAGQRLDLQPDLKPVFCSPYLGHFRAGIAFYHVTYTPW